jgi:hypothetical protein
MIVLVMCSAAAPASLGAALPFEPPPATARFEDRHALSLDQLSDGQFVYGPNVDGFSTRDYLVATESSLIPYADTIENWCGYASVNPRVVLALMEMRGRAVTGKAHAATSPAGTSGDLDSQIKAMVMDLALTFYRHLYHMAAAAVPR